MQIQMYADELYPVFRPVTDPEDVAWREGELTFEVDPMTLLRWHNAQALWSAAQTEMRDLVTPKCPECGHRQIRHQEWSEGWDNWACLECKTCRHGIPPEREAELAHRDQAYDNDGPLYVDPPGCGCADCLTGYSRPARDLEEYESTPAKYRR